MFAVFDNKAGAHAAPFFATTIGLARRYFADAVNQPDHPLAKCPEDFTLFHLGHWDDETAIFTPMPQAHSLGLATQFKKEPSNV